MGVTVGVAVGTTLWETQDSNGDMSISMLLTHLGGRFIKSLWRIHLNAVCD